ncbi:sensor histidine kinase [Sphingomonas xinjiangensis]|uniref:Signal transduction histidine kinase n=1 Tax=Sphingomonas xinjiangensis TaxID=643568 RepID=A0A840YP06_9SPHN|nr:triple tyrosine motif-containing protein [Sphingomonas xinjiangensis]MBB5711850.1 signal transduction histidine kinase [Sphingomonas xinjiangensis]
MQVICPARGGSVWLGYTDRAVRLGDRGENRITIPGPPGPIHACVEDAQGRLWLTGEGALRWHDANGWHGLPSDRMGGKGTEEIVTGPEREVVFNVRGTRFGIIVGNSARSLSAARVGIGYVNGISRGLDYVLVNGTTGLARVRNGVVSTLESKRYPWAARLRDAVQTISGETWLLGMTGLVRVRTAELNRAFDNPGSPVAAETFDSRDGLASGPQHFGVRGTQMAVGGDGRLWILSRSGLYSLDPSQLVPNKVPPVVSITGLSAGPLNIRDPANASLPTGTTSLTISYTALSLAVPGRNQFRYRLEGIDEGWVDPGTRRQAFYTRLGPGTYRFHVIAANNDGTWNRAGAATRIHIPPTFVQSRLFLVLCAVAAGGLLVGLYSARLRYLTRRIRAQMEARLAEREQIARDLHDTLLQSIQGLMIRFHGLALRPGLDASTRREIDEALDQAEAAVVEGREQVAGLRSARIVGLPRQLDEFIASLPAGPTPFLQIDGDERLLEPLVMEEAMKISREAILNASRHASASTIQVTLNFRADRFSVRVEDDGVGVAREVLAAGRREGHFGLPGMVERARRIGGELNIRSTLGSGTSITLQVPARLAYLRGRRANRGLTRVRAASR